MLAIKLDPNNKVESLEATALALCGGDTRATIELMLCAVITRLVLQGMPTEMIHEGVNKIIEHYTILQADNDNTTKH